VHLPRLNGLVITRSSRDAGRIREGGAPGGPAPRCPDGSERHRFFSKPHDAPRYLCYREQCK